MKKITLLLLFVLGFLGAHSRLPGITGEEDPVQVYPNPSTGIVHAALKGMDFEELTVVDNLGRIVVQQRIASGQTRLDIKFNRLPGGIYYLHFIGKAGPFVRKLVLQP